MPNRQTMYPAMIAGYFADATAAEAAMAQLQLLDTGPLDTHFDRVNILRPEADVPFDEPASTLPTWLTRLFGRNAPEEFAVMPAPSTCVVMTRGAADRLTSLVEPMLRSQGAYEIKHYSSWDPGDAEERTSIGSRQKSLKQLMSNAGMLGD